MTANAVQVPHNYLPRPYQVPFWRAMEAGCKRAVLVRHRRAGKDLDAWNFLITRAVLDVGTYFYVFPELGQAKKAIWDGFTNDGRPFLSYIPPELILNKRNDEMRIQIRSIKGNEGSIIQFVSADRVDNIVGTNIKGGIFSEFSIQNKAALEYLQPSILAVEGFMIFPYTPRGRNHGFELYQNALENPDWHCERLTIDDTRRPLIEDGKVVIGDDGSPVMVPIITQEMIDEQRRMGTPEEIIQQEYYCSFDAPLVGAYFSQQMRYAEQNGRIDFFAHTAGLPVHTAWDIGVNDKTAIIFLQVQRGMIRVIDYVEATGEGLPFFAKELHAKPYVYGVHLAPHDIAVRDWSTGVSRFETAESLGIKFTPVARLDKKDQIDAARALLSRTFFDVTRSSKLIDSLKSYTKKYDDKRQIYLDTPEHNWASHAADAYMTLAVGENFIDRHARVVTQPPKANTKFQSRHRLSNASRGKSTGASRKRR